MKVIPRIMGGEELQSLGLRCLNPAGLTSDPFFLCKEAV